MHKGNPRHEKVVDLKTLDREHLAEQNKTRRPQDVSEVAKDYSQDLTSRLRGKVEGDGQDIEQGSMKQTPFEPRGTGGTAKGDKDYQGG